MPIKKSDKTELLEKLNELLKKQSLFQQEINELQLEITQLKAEKEVEVPVSEKSIPTEVPLYTPKAESKKPVMETPKKKFQSTQRQNEPMTLDDLWKKTGIGSELEQFIGTNLINKIGMIVVIIGVGIGAKYAIDNDLISPLVRILLGYLIGGLLTFFALRLKKNYFNFSAVLISGSMTIHYFITYAAYSYYQLYSNSATFALMVLFTVITVALALYYNQQVIAHYGLIGAYLVPFLIGDPDSSIIVLFIYMLIINMGILFISTKKRWKPMNYLAFLATWVIFITWFASDRYNEQLGISLIFSSLFFVVFYLVFLSYKLHLKEKLKIDDIVYLLLNACVFYFVGTISLIMNEVNTTYDGLFTICNAIVHGGTAYLIYKFETENKNLFYWTIALFIAFVTAAVGVQFNEFIITIIWVIEAVILFWLARKQKIQLLDYLSFSLICISFISFASNQATLSYSFYSDSILNTYTPMLNMPFLSGLTVIAAFSLIFYINKGFTSSGGKLANWLNTFNTLFPIFFLIVLFVTFYSQINLYWNNIQVYTSYELDGSDNWIKVYKKLNNDIFTFRGIWVLNYTLLFTSVLAFVNYKWIQNKIFNSFIYILGGIILLIFLSSGLAALGILRKSYMNTALPENYDVNIFHLLIRYVLYMFSALLFYSIYKFILPGLQNITFKKMYEIALAISLICVCSSELIHWLSLSGTNEVYKHSLSILWGVLSFMLVGYGIWKKKKHLRITSIILFSGTILKLFFYDLTQLDTIPKTIVFISIGALLLIVSFMYNKYRELLFGND